MLRLTLIINIRIRLTLNLSFTIINSYLTKFFHLNNNLKLSLIIVLRVILKDFKSRLIIFNVSLYL